MRIARLISLSLSGLLCAVTPAPVPQRVCLTLMLDAPVPGWEDSRAALASEVREWLTDCGIGLAADGDAASPRLRVRIAVRTGKDGLAWHAVEAGLALPSGKGEATAFHLLAQKGDEHLREFVQGTLYRTLKEVTGASPQPGRRPLSNWARWPLGVGTNRMEPLTTAFDFTALKVRFQPPAPPYPPLALQRKVEGTVVVALMVDTKGIPVLAEAVSGPDELSQSAMAYALSWTFEPAKFNEMARPASFTLTMPYRIQ